MALRIKISKMIISRARSQVMGKCRMIKHNRDLLIEVNPKWFDKTGGGQRRHDEIWD